MNRPPSIFRLPLSAFLLAACCLLPAVYSPAQCPGGNCPITLAPSPRYPVAPSPSYRQPAPAPSAKAPNLGPAPVWQYAQATGHYRSVVRIEGRVGVASQKLGSGVVVQWGDHKAILTAGHVARGCREVRIYLPAAKRWATARVVKIDDAWDVAVLVLPEADAAELTAADIAWGDDATPERVKLASCGFGPDGRLAVNSGVCLDYRGNGASGRQADWLELSGRARQGDSGGPVFDDKNHVVGVLWGTDDRTVTATQAGYLHQLLAESLGPWPQSGERKAEGEPGLVAASSDVATADETCDGKLLGRLRGKTKAPATPAPPQVVVNPDPEVHAGLRQIEGTLGQVAQNTAPKSEPSSPAGVPEWAKILCVIAALAVGGFVFYVVQQN